MSSGHTDPPQKAPVGIIFHVVWTKSTGHQAKHHSLWFFTVLMATGRPQGSILSPMSISCFTKLVLADVHSRHNAREMKHLRGQVGQVGVEEDEERRDDLGPGGEARGERRHQAKEEAHKETPEAHHHHPAAPQQHVQARYRRQA